MAQNAEHLNKLLEQIAKEQNFVNYDIKIEPISSGGANYTSALYNINISEGDKVLYMFAKLAILGASLRTDAPKVYEIESFAYTKILKAFERLENEHQVPEEHRLVFSKFYGYNPSVYEETIVLENLVKVGYQSYDRFKSIDWPYTKSALRDLAKMHALSLAYSEYHSVEFMEIIEELQNKWKSENRQIKDYYKSLMTKAVDKTRAKNRDKLRRFFDGVDGDVFGTLYNKWGRRPVIGHGDFRPSNLLHRTRDVSTLINGRT